MTANLDLEVKAREIGITFSHQVNLAPSGYTQLLTGLLFAVGPTYEVVITGEPEGTDTKKMINALRRDYSPNKVLLFHPLKDQDSMIFSLAPFVEFQISIGGKATAYVCKDYTCSAPTTDINEMLKTLKRAD
jgi:uncharacterized protein YyaL (SSP411 family)